MRPLKGVRVVSIEQAVAAPFCTSRLADAGAEVIKIERSEGDFARGYDDVVAGQSSYFVWLNRGKQSRIIDIKSPEGREELTHLLGESDILVQNLKRGALARLGFPFKRLAAQFPKLITCSISGYGEGGPMVDRKAYDLLVQAESGLCSITGGPSEPARVGISLVDIATGATAHSAILEALIRRGVTGQGANISISMFDVIADWLTVPLLNHEGGKSPKRMGLAHPSIAPYGVFTAGDGAQVLLAVQSDAEWKKLCAVFLEQPQLATDPRFATNVARVANREKTDAVVSARFAAMTTEEAVQALLRADVALAQINDMEGLSKHPHLRRISVDTPNGRVSYPAPAPVWEDEPRHYGPVPGLMPIKGEL